MSGAWLTASEIAASWDGVTIQRVAVLMFHVGIGLDSKHMKMGQGAIDVYSPDAVRLIERELLSRGYKRRSSDG